jgi:antitoxin component YwqK of YwqJK toxin-antitoxin module
MMKRVLIISVFILLIASCSEDKNKTYYPNGKLRLEAIMKDGKMNGPAKVYYETGELQWEGTLVNDLKDGLIIKYYLNGNKESEIYYKNGKEHGSIKTYYESGKLKASATIIDGKENGLSKDYFETGELKSEGNYVNGLAEGEQKIYFPNKKLEMHALMEKNKPIYFKQFNEQGEEIKEHREVRTDITSNDIKLGATFTARLTLTGPTDNVTIEPFGGQAREDEEIKFMGKLSINDKNEAIYTFTPKMKGTYIWRAWMDTRDTNNNIKKYTYEGRVNVEN